MKKANFSYLAVWAGIPAVVAAVLVILAFTVFMDNKGIFVGAVFVAVGTVVAIPMLLESRSWQKRWRRISNHRGLRTNTNLRQTMQCTMLIKAEKWVWYTAAILLSSSLWI